jgi:hypothetical protein
MTRLRGSWTAIAAVTLFLLSACARTDDTAGAPAPDVSSGPRSPGSSAPAGTTPDSLVLRVERVGGFMAPDQQLGRLPVISVYGDGRIITQGPQTAVYPGPALPNILVQQVDPATLGGLLDKAAAAGVKGGADLGTPGVADAPTTRITVAVPGGTRTVDAVALTEAQPNDPKLTAAQRDARAKLAAFVQELSDLSASKAMPDAQPYQPVAVAAFARPYTASPDGLPKQPGPIAWPGPALPGTTFSGQAGCVTAGGADAAKVLTAAKAAKAITPWTSGGRQWTVVFRPLLPDEAGCADLKAKAGR